VCRMPSLFSYFFNLTSSSSICYFPATLPLGLHPQHIREKWLHSFVAVPKTRRPHVPFPSCARDFAFHFALPVPALSRHGPKSRHSVARHSPSASQWIRGRLHRQRSFGNSTRFHSPAQWRPHHLSVDLRFGSLHRCDWRYLELRRLGLEGHRRQQS